MNKLGFTEKQVGRMTFGKFSRLYQAYRNNFDMEMMMTAQKIRYSELDKEITMSDVIPY